MDGWWVGQWAFPVWLFCITAGYSSLTEARDHGGEPLRLYGFVTVAEKELLLCTNDFSLHEC